jgi:hypothetical protein
MDWKTRQGTQAEKPAILDIVSSPHTVYLRKNIVQKTVKDIQSGNKHKVWEYDEVQFSTAEYEREPVAINEMAQLIEQNKDSQQTYAEILLGQAEQQATLDAQDETLAALLENTL